MAAIKSLFSHPPTTCFYSFITAFIFRCVLGLAEMELIFPIAALIVLCFVLVARKVLITYQCFGYC